MQSGFSESDNTIAGFSHQFEFRIAHIICGASNEGITIQAMLRKSPALELGAASGLNSEMSACSIARKHD
jgi:hypothetical protein